MYKRPPTIVERFFKKPPSFAPPPKIVNPWPQGAERVNIYLWKQIGDLIPGRYTLLKQQKPYSESDEPYYTIYGKMGSWIESSLIQLVNAGEIMVLPDQSK